MINSVKANRIDWKSLGISIAISVGVGLLGSLFTFNSMDIYENLRLPPLSPPSYIFPIVWSVLYVLMGISSYIVYKSTSKDRSFALSIYALQLGLNFVWTLLFFNAKTYFLCFILLIVLWVLVLGMIRGFNLVNKVAGYLQVPYLLWVTFAGYLTLMIALLNR